MARKKKVEAPIVDVEVKKVERKPVYVYVSGPLTTGDLCENTNAAIIAATKLLDAGMTPFVPHLSVLWSVVAQRPYETWMRMDLDWVIRCDILLRLPGESKGADREVDCARQWGRTVYYDVDELVAAYHKGYG